MKKFSAIPPEDAKIKVPPFPNSRMPLVAGLIQPAPALGEIISWSMPPNPQYGPYHNNRGDGRIDDHRVNKMAAALHVASMDGFKVALMSEGPMLIDAHNRLQAALICYWRGQLTEAQLCTPVAFRLFPEEEWIKVYQDSHANQQSSTKREAIRSPDFVFGDIIFNRLLPLLPKPEQAKFYEENSEFLVNLTTVLYTLHKGVDLTNYSVWNFHDIYPYRSLVVPDVLYLPRGSYRIKREQLESVALVLANYYDLCKEGEHCLFQGKDSKKVAKSSVFFGFYLVESLCPSSRLSHWGQRKNNKIAANVRSQMVEIEATVTLLCNGSSIQMEKRMERLYDLLDGKNPNRKESQSRKKVVRPQA